MTSSAPSLSELQARFRTALMSGTEEDVAAFAREIAPGGRITPQQRLRIYAHAYQARLRETLQQDFPVLQAMLGDDAFTELCAAYAAAHPSRHPSLRLYGQSLPDFLAIRTPYDALPVLAEMAAFEWGFVTVFDAGDAPVAAVEDVARIPPPVWTTLRLGFHPSLILLEAAWNVPAIWSSVSGGAQPVLPEKLPQKGTILLWRHDLMSYFRSLAPDEARLLRLARAGEPFPVLCEALVPEYGDHAPLRAAELLKCWISEGLVSVLEHVEITPFHQKCDEL